MRKLIAALAVVGMMGAAACEADRETFEETDATLAPPPGIEAARENPVNPTNEGVGEALADPMAPDTTMGAGMPADTMR